MSDIKQIGELLKEFSAQIEQKIGGKVHMAWQPKSVMEHPVDVLKAIICTRLGVTWKQITSPTRREPVKEARHLFCYFAKMNYSLTLRTIGDMIGGRDHTTVINSINVVNNLMDAKDYSMCTKFNIIQKDVFAYEETKNQTETKETTLGSAGH